MNVPRYCNVPELRGEAPRNRSAPSLPASYPSARTRYIAVLRVCHATRPLSASTRYLGLARISRAAPWRQLPRPPLSLLCSVWRFLDTPRHLESRAWASQEDTHIENLPLGYPHTWCAPPPLLSCPLPLSASRAPLPSTARRKPHLGWWWLEGFLLCSTMLTLWQCISTESWLIQTLRPTGWTSCAFE